MPSRDPYLDCLKGFAIAIVVLGHTFQGATPDFDHYLPFRIVYSFHMPMFMFVAGMTASFSFARRLNTELNLVSYLVEIRSRAIRLLVPFATWAVIQYFVLRPEGYGPATWLLHVFQVPDSGLWFLLTLFQCCCVLMFVSITVQCILMARAARRPGASGDSTALYLTVIVVGIVIKFVIRAIPLSGTFLPNGYFIYFFAGVVFHMILPAGIPKLLRWIPYVMFLALAPFWYRTEMSPVASFFWNPKLANSVFGYLVAFAGTLAFVDLIRLFVDTAAPSLVRPASYVGKRSLDIYAIHFYFLGYIPQVIAPIAISLAVSLLLRTNAVTSWLCLGQAPLKLWPKRRWQLSVESSKSGMAEKPLSISGE